MTKANIYKLSEFEQRLTELYLPSDKHFTVVDVPKVQFAMINGSDKPAGEEYMHAINWLFEVIQPLKKIAKQHMGKKFKHPPLECLYWGDDFLNWQLMIVLPDWANDEIFADATEQASIKLGTPPKTLRKESFHEGKCVQIMHVGAPKSQAVTIEKMHTEFLPNNNLTARGHHHEIYLNDAKKITAKKLKTVLRQPII